ncbi:hypothetical protein [Roseovarius ramblicola]|uniref:Uncharacterized protein n=1 Tax=Roseovarius ramblicola TaxID=2022336 RepID=A0ABV5I0L9_9RHOB
MKCLDPCGQVSVPACNSVTLKRRHFHRTVDAASGTALPWVGSQYHIGGKALKNLVCAIACATTFAASPVLAGALSDPVVEPEVIVTETTETSQDVSQLIIPLMLIMIIVGMGV